MEINSYLNLKIFGADVKSAKKITFNQFGENALYICLQVDGESCVSYGGNKETILPGCVFIVPDSATYTLSKGNKSSICCICVEARVKYDGGILVYNTESPSKVEDIFKETIKIYSGKLYNSEFLCLSNIYKIMSCTISEENNYSNGNKNVIAPALNFIFSNIYNPELSLEVACKVAGISRVYFNRLFLQNYNITPTKFINNIRIEKACYLLKSGIYSREEISSLSGFSNLKYFYTVFKGIAGCTTGQYCKKGKK